MTGQSDMDQNGGSKTGVANPHDKLFRETWSDKAAAVDFVKNYLPGNVLRHIDPNSLEICKDSFVEKELRDYFSDLVYKVRICGENGYLHFLFEHKSFGDKLSSLQILEYKTKIWRLDLKQKKPREPIPLPVIVPILLYHGKEKWIHGNTFGRLFGEYPQDLSVYIPDFEFVLVNLSEYDDENIRGTVATRVTMLLFRHIFDPDIVGKLPKIISLLNELSDSQSGLECFGKYLRYLFSTVDGMTTVDELKNIFENTLSREKGGFIMTLEEHLLEKGMQQGMQQLIELGLSHRFGEKASHLIEKIRQIQDLDRLKTIMEIILKLDNLSEVEKLVRH